MPTLWALALRLQVQTSVQVQMQAQIQVQMVRMEQRMMMSSVLEAAKMMTEAVAVALAAVMTMMDLAMRSRQVSTLYVALPLPCTVDALCFVHQHASAPQYMHVQHTHAT